MSEAQAITLSTLVQARGPAALTWQMERTLAAMVRRGWIEKVPGRHMYQITPKGRAAHLKEFNRATR